ncbi:MAG: TetR/AcrR family transcriptional regulator [Pseudomonadota bacterium]
MPRHPQARTKKDVVTEFRETEIIDAARRVIVRDGPRNASMEKIADEANISKGTLYLYFDNKEALVREAAERGHAEMARAVIKVTRGATEPLAAVEAYVHAVLQFCDENEILFRAMDAHPDSAGDPAAKAVDRRINEYVGMLEQIIKNGIKAGVFQKIDARRAARILVEAVRGVVIERLRDRKRPTVEDDTATLMAILTSGIKS